MQFVICHAGTASRGQQALRPLHAEGSRHSGHCMQREAGTQAIACRGKQALRPLHAEVSRHSGHCMQISYLPVEPHSFPQDAPHLMREVIRGSSVAIRWFHSFPHDAPHLAPQPVAPPGRRRRWLARNLPQSPAISVKRRFRHRKRCVGHPHRPPTAPPAHRSQPQRRSWAPAAERRVGHRRSWVHAA